MYINLLPHSWLRLTFNGLLQGTVGGSIQWTVTVYRGRVILMLHISYLKRYINVIGITHIVKPFGGTTAWGAMFTTYYIHSKLTSWRYRYLKFSEKKNIFILYSNYLQLKCVKNNCRINTYQVKFKHILEISEWNVSLNLTEKKLITGYRFADLQFVKWFNHTYFLQNYCQF